jgi:phosphohistidine phosphatase
VDVIVVRHAAAMDREEARGAGLLDRDRPLTAKGHSRMRRAARGLRELVPDAGSIITSPFRRAMETALTLQRHFKGAQLLETDALLPEAAPEDLARFLLEMGPAAPPILVGHEPHLSAWLSWCLTGEGTTAFELRKGGAYMLRFEAAPGPKLGRLVWLFTPAVLRRL